MQMTLDMNPVRTIVWSLVATISVLSGCTRAQVPPTREIGIGQNKRILIVYLSRTNNTKAVAEMIHQQTGGDLVGIELKTPYPRDYQTTVKQVAKENETGFLPPLITTIDSIGKYDLIFIGFPTWGMQLPPPVKSFLRQHKLEGKTVAPFNTNAGNGIGISFRTVKELCPNSIVLDGFSIQGGIERDGILFVMEGEKKKLASDEVTKWLKTIKVLQ
jgi:flavodoxin